MARGVTGLTQSQLDNSDLKVAMAPYERAQQDKTAKNAADERLFELIRGKNADQENMLAGKQADVTNQATETQNKISALKQLNDSGMVPDGGSASVEGISVGADPYAKLMGKTQQGGAHAIEAAQKVYNSGLSKIAPVAQAASEGLALTNDPRNTGSMGQARTLMLKAMGMNRYNEQEAKAVLPPSLQGVVSQMFNTTGDDQNPLNDSQRRTIATFFKGQLDNAKQQHEILKANANNMYQQSPYYDAARGSQLQGSMGAPVDTMITGALGKYKDLPDTHTDPSQRPAPTGMVDKLRSFLTGSPSAPQAQGQAPQSKPQTVMQNGHTYNLNPQTGQYE